VLTRVIQSKYSAGFAAPGTRLEQSTIEKWGAAAGELLVWRARSWKSVSSLNLVHWMGDMEVMTTHGFSCARSPVSATVVKISISAMTL